MNYGKTSSKRTTVFLLLFSSLLFTSCATPRWTTLLEGEQKSEMETAFAQFISSQELCTPSWDAELDITWTSAVKNYSFSAYARMLEPSYLKIIVSNPLGQPLKIIGTDGLTYQAIDAVERSIVTGSLSSWVDHHDLPVSLATGSWLNWLAGRSSVSANQIGDIRLDAQHRGAWFSILDDDTGAIVEHLLFDNEKGRIVERVLVDEHSKPFATLEHSRWQQIGGCLYPTVLSIGGLPLSGQAKLRFSEIQQNTFVPIDFRVDPPPSFRRTWLP